MSWWHNMVRTLFPVTENDHSMGTLPCSKRNSWKCHHRNPATINTHNTKYIRLIDWSIDKIRYIQICSRTYCPDNCEGHWRLEYHRRTLFALDSFFSARTVMDRRRRYGEPPAAHADYRTRTALPPVSGCASVDSGCPQTGWRGSRRKIAMNCTLSIQSQTSWQTRTPTRINVPNSVIVALPQSAIHERMIVAGNRATQTWLTLTFDTNTSQLHQVKSRCVCTCMIHI